MVYRAEGVEPARAERDAALIADKNKLSYPPFSFADQRVRAALAVNGP